jgi:hypothetical protein
MWLCGVLILPLNVISVMMALRPHVVNLYVNKSIIDIYMGNTMVCHWALLGNVMVCHWALLGNVTVCHWALLGNVIVCHWALLGNVTVCHWALLPWYFTVCNESV